MKTDVRTKLTEFGDGDNAAFDMIDTVTQNPTMDTELDGATHRARRDFRKWQIHDA
jgi:hypothetical protein